MASGYRPGLTEGFKIKCTGISMAVGEYLLRVIQANNAQQQGDIYVVYKLVTGAKILMVDLVSPTGSDPRQVKSFGVIKGGVLPWQGQVLSADGKSLRGKMYRMHISLLKHFGDLEKDEDFESNPFTLH
ncbi:hypothetical protein CPB97_006379 [Podila verticillata]|nr:hypothetical protein CPB97_006379 [Podila verticillata]